MDPLTRDRAVYILAAAGWLPVDIAAAFGLSVPEVKKANKRHWGALGRPEKIDPEKLVAMAGRIRPTQVAALDDYLHAAKEIGVTVHLPAVVVRPGEDVFDAMIREGVAPNYGVMEGLLPRGVQLPGEAAAHARGEIPPRTIRFDKDGNRITGLEYVDGRPEEGETGARPGGAYRDAGKTEGGL